MAALLYFLFVSFLAQGQGLLDVPKTSHIPSTSLRILNDDQIEEVERLGQDGIAHQIEVLQKKKIPLELLRTDRKGGARYFEALGPATRSIEQITELEGLYGKAVCPSGKEKAKILVAEDAPPSTLLHEYVHWLQIQQDPRWCQLDGKVLEGDEKKERALIYHRFEFEALKLLWDFREKFALSFEDRLILIEGLHRENSLFQSMGVKALDSATATEVREGLEQIRSQINFLTWVTKSRDDAGAVLQKMEVVALKSCVEQSKDKSEDQRINNCLEKRCELSGIKCREVSEKELNKHDDLLAKITYTWLKPYFPDECPVNKLRDELLDNVEGSTPCWKKWYATQAKKDKSLELQPQVAKELLKKYGAPSLKIDSQIGFYSSPNPESFINSTYCYFIFQKIAAFESLPVSQFAYAAQGGTLDLDKMKEYGTWLKKSDSGKTCSKVVKLFTGEGPDTLESYGRGKKYLFIHNPLGALGGGLGKLKSVLKTDLNHLRLHIIFGEDKGLRKKIKEEWEKLSSEEKESFKKKNPSYDFRNEETLLKEYFSFSRQDDPTQL